MFYPPETDKMLAIDCVPRLTQELVGRCRDPTISELYEERKLLIHRLLKCDATTIANAHLDMKKQNEEIDTVRSFVRQLGKELSPSLEQHIYDSTNSLNSDTESKTSFTRTTASKGKLEQKQGNRDSGFSERSYASSCGQSLSSHYSSKSNFSEESVFFTQKQILGKQVCNCPSEQTSDEKSKESDTTKQEHTQTEGSSSSHSDSATVSATTQSRQSHDFANSSKAHAEAYKQHEKSRHADTDSVKSSHTITDSHSSTRSISNGLNVAVEYRSIRPSRPLQFAHQDSMFGVFERSPLYFPNHRRKSNIIRNKLHH
ncbi:uncharacterized protein [Watersipora subatra]|uniref:uncharacterized protein n=1 Tax=Watersipora subatra TaxID=2589382 RepID=UPI00355BBC29